MIPSDVGAPEDWSLDSWAGKMPREQCHHVVEGRIAAVGKMDSKLEWKGGQLAGDIGSCGERRTPGGEGKVDQGLFLPAQD